MKIIAVQEHTLEAGVNQTTAIELDERAGLFFEFITATFKTPVFTINNHDVPAIMVHGDRNPDNVSITISNGILNVQQKYRQSPVGYLIVKANNDWTPPVQPDDE